MSAVASAIVVIQCLPTGTLLAIKSAVPMNLLKNKIEDFERQAIINSLDDCGWVMARAARKIGITERMIGYKIKKYGIKREVNGKCGESVEQMDIE